MKNDKKIILFVSTAVPGEVSARVFGKSKKIEMKIKGKSDELLVLVDRVLKKNKMKPGDLGGIAVISGPGSFTALRQGIVAANTISYVLEIPVAGIRLDEFSNDDELITVIYEKIKKAKVGEIVLPFYGGEPNITTPRGI